jgi:hypothetical protein
VSTHGESLPGFSDDVPALSARLPKGPNDVSGAEATRPPFFEKAVLD